MTGGEVVHCGTCGVRVVLKEWRLPDRNQYRWVVPGTRKARCTPGRRHHPDPSSPNAIIGDAP